MTNRLESLPVWLISLERAADRRQRMVERLSRLGLAYTMFDGIDGKAREAELLASMDQAAFMRNMGRGILIGGIGCYHSHLGVWRAFLATDAEVALVLEDDVVFHDDFVTALQLGLQAKKHWDFLKLNCIRAKLPVRQGYVGPYALNAYLGPATGTGAYLIKRDTAARLLAGMLPVTRATDHEINRFFVHRFRLRGLEPFPSHLEEGDSLIATGPQGYGGICKFVWYRRLPNYRLRIANYLRRGWWMLKEGEIWPRSTRLLTEQPNQQDSDD
ncbi:MAG: glycosyltransferase family 25 protein [Tabrizicola sp.]